MKEVEETIGRLTSAAAGAAGVFSGVKTV